MSLLLYVFIFLLVGQIILFTLMMYATYKMLNEYKKEFGNLYNDLQIITSHIKLYAHRITPKKQS